MLDLSNQIGRGVVVWYKGGGVMVAAKSMVVPGLVAVGMFSVWLGVNEAWSSTVCVCVCVCMRREGRLRWMREMTRCAVLV